VHELGRLLFTPRAGKRVEIVKGLKRYVSMLALDSL
jgi:hypothetical protein